MDKLDLWKKSSGLRKQLGEDTQSPIEIFSLVHNLDNLTVVFYPMGDRMSGVCIKNRNNNVIAINSAMSVGRQRFSMAHELFHLFYDSSNFVTIVCSKTIGAGKPIEKEADQFASYFLMPPDALTDMLQKLKKENNENLTLNCIVKLEQHFRVSRQAILFRLVDEGELTSSQADTMRQNVIYSARCLGYDDTLYKPLPAEKQYMTYGNYIKQADEVFEKGLISNGKYEELLLDAFRTDLVYGDLSEGGELID